MMDDDHGGLLMTDEASFCHCRCCFTVLMSRCGAGEAGERSLKNTLQQFVNEFLVASKAGNLLESKLVMSHYDSTGTNSSELHAKKKEI
jgi:hypothetical protein